MRVECRTYDEWVAFRLNDAFIRTRRMVDTVDSMRVALGKVVMPREWLDTISDGNEVERTLWLTSELLKSHAERP